MKDYIGCLIPIVIVLAIGTLITFHNKRVEQREEQEKLEKEKRRKESVELEKAEPVWITQGEYSRYIEYYTIDPCLDKFRGRDFITKGELGKLPISIDHSSDTIEVFSIRTLREAAIVFHSLTESDTLDFEYDGCLYIVKCSKNSLAWDDMNKVSFLFKMSGDTIRHEFSLSKKEFAKHFEDIVPYVALKKNKEIQ